MIDGFDGQHRFMSNFFLCIVTLDGDSYPSTEHAYQAAKFFGDRREYFKGDVTPAQAKRKAAELKELGFQRSDWTQVNIGIMTDLLRQKFAKNGLRAMLLSTGNEELVEGNHWHDNFWGHCHCKYCAKLEHHNNLGKLLMMIRKEIREEACAASSGG